MSKSERYARWNEMLKQLPPMQRGIAKHIMFVYLCDASPLEMWIRLAERAIAVSGARHASRQNQNLKKKLQKHPEQFSFPEEKADDF
jgi:hypothetical protein